MSTNADYRYAKKLFDDHVAQHQCKAMMLLHRGGERCDERRRLFEQMVAIGGRLGKDD